MWSIYNNYIKNIVLTFIVFSKAFQHSWSFGESENGRGKALRRCWHPRRCKHDIDCAAKLHSSVFRWSNGRLLGWASLMQHFSYFQPKLQYFFPRNARYKGFKIITFIKKCHIRVQKKRCNRNLKAGRLSFEEYTELWKSDASTCLVDHSSKAMLWWDR